MEVGRVAFRFAIKVECEDTKGLFPVGRLDKDTEGLLFLTNDGEFNHQLMYPDQHVKKTYYFWAFGTLDDEQINKLEKQDLLIIDDFGLKALDAINRHSFMEIIEDRHGEHSIIIASQLPVEAWHEIIGEQTIADAILDRLVHNAHRIDIKGESMRKKLKNKD